MNSRHYFFVCYLLFFTGISNSQEKDSLAIMSYQTLKDRYKEFNYSKPKIAKTYIDALIQKATKEDNLPEKHEAFLLKSSSESYFGDMKSSLHYIDTVVTYANATKNNLLYVKALSQKGKTYFTFGKYNDAITYYLQLDAFARETANIRYQIYSNHSIGSIKNITGDHKGAVALFLKNKDIITPIIEEKKYHTLYINMLIGLISAYTYFDVDKAAEYLPELKTLSITQQDNDALTYYYNLQGIVNYKRKEYGKALLILAKADSLIHALGTKRNLYSVYRFRGKIYYEQDMFLEAIVAFESIKTLRKEIEFDDFRYGEVLSLLASSYEQLDSSQKALTNYRLALNFSYTDTIEKDIRNIISEEYDKKTLESKIESLKNNSNQKTIQNRSLWIISSGLLIAFLMLLWIYKKQQRDNKKKFDEVLQKLTVEATEGDASEASGKYQISDEKITKILEGLQKFEKSHAFLHQNTSLVTVAKKLNTNTTYLSQIVNEQKGMTFKNYITELRINYVLYKLKNDKVIRSYTVKAIAKELGFKSEGAFSRAFKKQTGIYPSFFIKNITSI